MRAGCDDIYLLRVEQLYPVPDVSLTAELTRFPEAEFVWCQEEPQEPGRLELHRTGAGNGADQDRRQARPARRYAGRNASASPATGLASRHKAEQQTLVADALG